MSSGFKFEVFLSQIDSNDSDEVYKDKELIEEDTFITNDLLQKINEITPFNCYRKSSAISQELNFDLSSVDHSNETHEKTNSIGKSPILNKMNENSIDSLIFNNLKEDKTNSLSELKSHSNLNSIKSAQKNLSKKLDESSFESKNKTDYTKKDNEKLCLTNTKFPEENSRRKVFVEREGDWVCAKCRNLNFSFRVFCNRCKISKDQSICQFQEQLKYINNSSMTGEIYQSRNQQFLNYQYLMNQKLVEYGGNSDFGNRNYY